LIVTDRSHDKENGTHWVVFMKPRQGRQHVKPEDAP
jgi:hypothetical protein